MSPTRNELCSVHKGSGMAKRLKVGLVGAGVIAQVMHLHYLRELASIYEIYAICDVATERAKATAAKYSVPKVFSDWREMLKEPIDAVFVLSSGDHTRIVIDAANAGKHVLVEKPLCFTVSEGQDIRKAVAQSQVTLMVGYPKRYDPAFERFSHEASETEGPRLVRITTFESPSRPYVDHHPLTPMVRPPGDLVDPGAPQSGDRIDGALGDLDDFSREVYRDVLLDTLVHELNTTRAIFGEPDSVEFAGLNRSSVTVMLRIGNLPVAVHWLDLPGMTRYKMEFAVYGPDRRVTLSYPSPFLRDVPTLLEVEGGEVGSARSWRIEETTSHENAFKRELVAFYDCVVHARTPMTDVEDALHDIALCESIVRSYQTEGPISGPSRFIGALK